MTIRPSWEQTIEVVGMSFREANLEELLAGETSYRGTAALIPEPSNPYDPNAVKVVVDGVHVGYVSRKQTALVLDHLGKSDDWTMTTGATVYRLSKSHTPAVWLGPPPAATEPQLALIRTLASDLGEDWEDVSRVSDIVQASALIDRLRAKVRQGAY